MIRVHRIALDPNNTQRTALYRAAGVARFSYNWALARWIEQYEAGQRPNIFTLKRELNAYKRTDWPWMLESPKAASEQAILNLGKAWQRFFSGNSHKPRFKKKGVSDSFLANGDPKSIKVSDRSIWLPKIGWVRMRERLRFSGRIKSIVVSRDADRWFASVSVEVDNTHVDAVTMGRKNHGPVGVDLGIKDLATLSDGSRFSSPKALHQNLEKLRRLSKAHSRKRHGSKNRAKAAMKLARLHRRIANIRQDALHKLTTYLVRNYDEIVVEDLNVKSMQRNKKLARHITDMGFYEFRRQLEYKAERAGVKVTVANRWYPSSKLCSECGHKNENLTLDQRGWTCGSCGTRHYRDVNAAINLKNLAASSAVTACGEDRTDACFHSVRETTSTKQELVVESV